MEPYVLVIVAVVVLAAIAFFVLRGRKTTTTDEGTGAGPQVSPPTKPAEPVKPPVTPSTTSQQQPPPRTEPARVEPPTSPAPPPSTTTAGQPAATAVEPARTPEAAVPSAPVQPAATARAPEPAATRAETRRDVAALRKGLSQTRGGWVQRLVGIFSGKKELDPELLSQIEETLLTGDVGVHTTERLTAALKDRLGKKQLGDDEVVWSTLREVAREVLNVNAPAFGSRAKPGEPLVVLLVGVNGVGKTTTIGKLASRYKDRGKKVYLAAGDTFRAAAVAQLEAWGKRVGVPVVKGKDLSKPGAVVFDAVQTGAKEGADIVLADTAGRLHTKTPLMDELRKLRDAAGKALPGAPHEILLVLDATTGQNGLIQVKEFRDALDLTGIVLTKLDGTAKGGVILGICDEFKLPVRFVGVGEKVDDLREFDVDDFTQALFTRPSDDENEAA